MCVSPSVPKSLKLVFDSICCRGATKAPMDADLLLGLLAMIRPLSQGFRVGFSALRYGACVCCSCARFVRVWVRFVSVGVRVVCLILVFGACFAVLVLVS